jgi:hypothetical protein
VKIGRELSDAAGFVLTSCVPAGAPRQPPHLDADVAQLVEQLIRNQQVTGSSPVVGSTRHFDS